MDNPLAAGIKPVLVTVARMIFSTWAVFICYYALPVQTQPQKSDLPYLALHIAVFAVIVVVQIPVIVRSRHPGLRAIESTVLTILIFLTLFARLYYSAALTDPHSFNEMLTRTKALYFTVTIFATVGFGDIVATTDATQVLVTIQILLNLVVLGVVIKVLLSAGSRGMEHRVSSDDRRFLARFADAIRPHRGETGSTGVQRRPEERTGPRSDPSNPKSPPESNLG